MSRTRLRNFTKFKSFCTMKEGEKTVLTMWENNSKQNNWQRINLQNIQAAHATQYQKNNNPIKKWAKDLDRHIPKENIQMIINTWKDAQHHSFSLVQFTRSVISDSLQPHESQHTRPPCPPQTPGVYSNSCPSSRWCHTAISSSVVPFSFCP